MTALALLEGALLALPALLALALLGRRRPAPAPVAKRTPERNRE
ncbi:MAG TPA: hypothetical protein VF875_11720 [Anaeromyxobacter sp.]